MSRFSLIFLLLVFSFPARSQPVFFERVFGGPDAEIGRSVKEYSDGTIMFAGIRENGPVGGYDFALSRLDQSGNITWTKFFGTTADDNCLTMDTTRDGDLILAGETYTTSGMLDGFLIKIDTAGNEIWRKFVGTPLNESIRYISSTADGGFICAGYQNDAHGSNDSWFLRLDSVGGVIWSQAYGGWSTEYADMIRELPDGRFIATGDTRSMGAGGYDVEIFLLDEAGIPEFDLTFGDQFQNGCQGILVMNDGNFLSYGETEIYTSSSYEMFLEKIDTTGASVWRRTFGGSGTDAAFSVSEMSDGSFMITGYTTSAGSGPLNVAVAKANSSGYLQWMKAYGSTGIDIGYDIQPSVNGGFLIAGRTAPSDDQFYLLHLNDEGSLSDIVQGSGSPEISLYPNPATDQFVIEADGMIDSYEVCDLNGRMIIKGNGGASVIYVNSLQLAPGIYNVTIKMNSIVSCRKLAVFQAH